ncbi:hypothetical protein GGI05_002395, partial [Coemansia sp. RSA 2603]
MDEQKPHPQASKPDTSKPRGPQKSATAAAATATDQSGGTAKPARRRRTRSTAPEPVSNAQSSAPGNAQSQQQQPQQQKPRSNDAQRVQSKNKPKPPSAPGTPARSGQSAAAAAASTQAVSGNLPRRKNRNSSSAVSEPRVESGRPQTSVAADKTRAKNAERAPKPKAGAKPPAAGDPKKNSGKNVSRAASKAPSRVQSRAPSPNNQQSSRPDKPRTPRKDKKDNASQQKLSTPKGEPSTKKQKPKDTESGRRAVTTQSVETSPESSVQQAGGGQLEGIDRSKPMTKVCIRWLPADLPEHVFWKSVEPALLWHDPSVQGTVEQKQIHHAVAQLPTEAGDEGEAPETTDEATEAPADAPQMLAPTVATTIDIYRSPTVDLLDQPPYWRQYIRGKQHRTRGKPNDPSRAYIHFATTEEVDYFYRRYHGHVFSKNNVISRAVVELAPWQQVERGPGVDPLAGTLGDDPEFLAFLRKLNGIEDDAGKAAESEVVEKPAE